MTTDKIYGLEPWSDTIAAMDSYARIEVSEEVFDYFLGVLPPVKMLGNGVFWFAEGWEHIREFSCVYGSFFCEKKHIMNSET